MVCTVAHDGFDAKLTRTRQCTDALKHGRIPFQIPLFYSTPILSRMSVEDAKSVKAWTTAPLCGGWPNCIHPIFHPLRLMRTVSSCALCNWPVWTPEKQHQGEAATRTAWKQQVTWVSLGIGSQSGENQSQPCKDRVQEMNVQPPWLWSQEHHCAIPALVWESDWRAVQLNVNKTTLQCLVNISEEKTECKVGLFWRRQTAQPLSLWLRAVCSAREEQGVLGAAGRPARSSDLSINRCVCVTRRDARIWGGSDKPRRCRVERKCTQKSLKACWLGEDCPLFVHTLCSSCTDKNKQTEKTCEVLQLCSIFPATTRNLC